MTTITEEMFSFAGTSDCELHIPSTVTTIEKDGFFRCGFKTVYVPASVTSVGENAFVVYDTTIIFEENSFAFNADDMKDFEGTIYLKRSSKCADEGGTSLKVKDDIDLSEREIAENRLKMVNRDFSMEMEIFGKTPEEALASVDNEGWYEIITTEPSEYEITKDNISQVFPNAIAAYICDSVTWKNYDGTVLEYDPNVADGETPSYDGETPAKSENAQYTYDFAGWNPEVTAITADTEYTATFTPVLRSYDITWKNDDGSVIDTTTVEYGNVPTHADATKAEDDDYTYTFAGWTDGTNTYSLTDTLPNVIADVTYTAVFEGTMKPEVAVAAMINALPAEVTVADKDAIEAARAAYEALTDDQKALVDADTLAKLTAAEEAFAAAEQAAADQAAADEVVAMLDALPTEVTVDDADAIEAARAAYDALTDEQKALVSAESIAKLEAAEEALAAILVNDSYVENSSVAPGKSIKIIGAAKGGTAPYTFAYYFKKTVNTKWNKLGTEFGTATSAKFTPTSAGAYDIKVIVKDADGKEAEKLLTAESVGELTLDTGATVSASTIMYGEAVTITAAPTGGTAPYTCAFYFKRSTNTKWNALKAKGASAALTPTSICYYDLKCVVTDADGVTAQKTFQLFVDGVLPLENVSEINRGETVPVGTTITVSGRSRGGKAPITYEYFFKRSENTKWNTLKPSTDNGTYAKFTPTKAASYDIKVVATDSEGTKAEKIMTVTAVSAVE